LRCAFSLCFTFEYSPSYTALVMYSKFHTSACFYYLAIVFVVYPVLFMWLLLILHAVCFPYLPTTTAGKSQGRTLPSVQQLRYYRNRKHETACSEPPPLLPVKPEYGECSVQVEATGSREALAPSSRTAWRHFPEIDIIGDDMGTERKDRLAWHGELDS
jgi:hypothetical protein